MGDSSDVSAKFDNSDTIELTGKITVVVVLMIFLVIVFIFLLHVYAKWFWYRRREQSASAAPRRRLDLAQDHNSLSALRRGLDPLMLKTIPVVVFDAKDFKDGLECAVCLCEVSEGEKTRLLPKCNHGFHVECIDMWFQSHSTCPICRNLVANESALESVPESEQLQYDRNAEIHASEFPPNFPTNVLFWGNEVEVRTLGNYLEGQQQGVNSSQQAVSDTSDSSPSSSRSASNGLDGELVIEMPQEVNEDEEPEPKSPPQTRLRTLKRLLIRDTRVNPTIPREVDIEQESRS